VRENCDALRTEAKELDSVGISCGPCTVGDVEKPSEKAFSNTKNTSGNRGDMGKGVLAFVLALPVLEAFSVLNP